MLTAMLVFLVIISASLHIRAEYHGPRQHVYIFKPLTMVLIGLIAFLGQTSQPYYKFMIITGLLFSTAGDILLVLPSNQFLAGMGAFAIAHLFYILAFVSEIHVPVGWPLIPLLIYSFAIYRILYPSIGKLKLPICFYELVITMMAWLAWERWLQTGQSGALLAAIGAGLFIISDSILGLNRFHRVFETAHALTLITYFAAQGLIAGSIGALTWTMP